MESAPNIDREVDTDSWLTYAQVTDLLGITSQTVRSYRHKGKLNPRLALRQQVSGGQREVLVFDPQELARLPKRTLTSISSAGELAARAFELFDDGVSLRKVVTSLRETPGRVTELHEQWMELGGSELVIGRAAKVEIERIVGPFDGVAGLVERLSKLVDNSIHFDVDPRAQPHLAAASDAQIEGALVGILSQEDDAQPDSGREITTTDSAPSS